MSAARDGVMALLADCLPLVGAKVVLRFTRDATPGMFHEPALSSMLRTLAHGRLGEELPVWVRASESGRSEYAAGERYAFEVHALASNARALVDLLSWIASERHRLPADEAVPFGRSLALDGFVHPLDGRPLRQFQPALIHTLQQHTVERERLDASTVFVRLQSPLRVLRAQSERDRAKGEARYVHDGEQLAPVFARRVWDSLAAVARASGRVLERPQDEPVVVDQDVFLVDWDYRDAEGRSNTMAGLLGWIALDLRDCDSAWLDALLLAQRIGIGQRRRFGWGALRLEDRQRQGTLPSRRALRGLLQRAAEPAKVQAALSDSLNADDAPSAPPGHAAALDLCNQLLEGRYQPPELTGVVMPEPNGRLRALAVPPWHDRWAQRVVARELTRVVEQLFSPCSFGYRAGRSRHDVRAAIARLQREGYRHYFEADISAFFDHVEWSRIDTRLSALLGDDPALALIQAWIAAPVRYQGISIARERGLPQGSPLSPLLANLLLEDLDADFAAHGLQLLRYADDFVVLTRSEAEAQAAWRRAEASVGELGLRLKPSATRIGRLDREGLDFLGFRFIDGVSAEQPRARAGSLDQIRPQRHSWLEKLLDDRPELLQTLRADWTRRYGPFPAAVADPPAAPAEPLAVPATPEAPPEPQPEPLPAAVALAPPDAGSILCITEPALLAQQHGQLLVLQQARGAQRLPWTELDLVLLHAPVRLTSGAIHGALQHGVTLHFLGGTEGYRGRLVAEQQSVDDLDRALAQRSAFADPTRALALAAALVDARVHNQRETLRQRLRRSENESADVLADLAHAQRQALAAPDLAALNGIEGAAARRYFDAMGTLLPSWTAFVGRNRRPPKDPANALLSLGYSVLYARTQGLLTAAGWHPRLGFYHQPHGRHATLASDLMEPFRHLVERTAWTVLQRRELGADDFTVDPVRGCRLTPSALRRYLARLAETLSRPASTMDGDSLDFYHGMLRQIRALTSQLTLADSPPWFSRLR